MPPLTPRTTRLRVTICQAGSAVGGRGGQQTLVDLPQSDRHRLLVDPGLDERADVLEQALGELGVVRVDLARTLGRVDDQRVLGVRNLEQVVDRWVGDALGGSLRTRHGQSRFVGEDMNTATSGARQKIMRSSMIRVLRSPVEHCLLYTSPSPRD